MFRVRSPFAANRRPESPKELTLGDSWLTLSRSGRRSNWEFDRIIKLKQDLTTETPCVKRNSFASLLHATILVTIGLWCFFSLPAFAAEDPNQTNPSASPSPPSPPTPPLPPSPAQPYEASLQLTPEQGKEYWDRYVTGDWWGLRTLLHNWGIDFNLSYFGEMAGNVSGGKDHFSGYPKGFGQSWAYNDQGLFGVDLNFEKMIGWEGASFECYITKRSGNSLEEYVNPATLQLFQEAYGRGQTWRITDFWFKQAFFNDLLELKLGLMNMSQEFGGFYAFPFENLTFTAGITGNVAGYSMFTWPVSQWGTDLQWNATKDLAMRVGVFAFNTYWISSHSNNFLRLDNPGGTSGAVIPFEIDWRPKLPIFGKDLPGFWVLGAFGNTNHEEIGGVRQSVIGGAPGSGPFLSSRFWGDWGVYGSIWQQLTAPDPEHPKTGLSAFALSIFLDPRASYQNFQLSTGLYYWAPWSKRPHDSCGIATGYNRAAGNVRNAERAYITAHPGSGFDVQSNEWVEEIFYSFDVYHGFNIQPVVQYIINPGGYHNATNIVVLGCQVNVPL
jgi:porin